jgi:hypothetical protein
MTSAAMSTARRAVDVGRGGLMRGGATPSNAAGPPPARGGEVEAVNGGAGEAEGSPERMGVRSAEESIFFLFF